MFIKQRIPISSTISSEIRYPGWDILCTKLGLDMLRLLHAKTHLDRLDVIFDKTRRADII